MWLIWVFFCLQCHLLARRTQVLSSLSHPWQFLSVVTIGDWTLELSSPYLNGNHGPKLHWLSTATCFSLHFYQLTPFVGFFLVPEAHPASCFTQRFFQSCFASALNPGGLPPAHLALHRNWGPSPAHRAPSGANLALHFSWGAQT